MTLLQQDEPIADASLLAQRGRQADRNGTPVEALGWFERALAVLSEQPPGALLADVLRWKATALRECGGTAAADRLYQQSALVARDAGYSAGAAHAENCLGIVAQRRGDLAEAAHHYADAAALAELAGDATLGAMILRNSGTLGCIRGDWEGALACFEESRVRAESVGDRDGVMRALHNMGRLHMKCRRPAEAAPLLDRALALARDNDDALAETMCELSRAELHLDSGGLDEAERCCTRAMELAERRGDSLRRAKGLHVLGRLARLRGGVSTADLMLHEALALCVRGEDEHLRGEVLFEQGTLSRSRGDLDDARDRLRQARDVFASIDARPELLQVTRELGELAAR